ncbi:lipopolysaccharide biosynthesis protein [Rhodoblastus acidophilus]|uniref:Lipopolysaccharide biosynthesis protein n=1 Tax=Candidatus Rhodoblastus alkanivorans TaxID=2954117 RepID=A0ABS9Z3I5_9HYPH|nr:lipopolysaccharide biosynthesis protein [Candidatus Rhodoblastus alkanivorans]MCI4677546.1 lipopolysaccharide biosynthesis protein [Candidatus Rhodoblastus alkanivorans]MCI4681905.1 lipopolysaccharide biosynthesis protein [Candidatus Rhodoblastus alkanivorans]MDI4642955.1 lipopolysaccharide biosynthesis protein [Rhodoblastus acidophilus]
MSVVLTFLVNTIFNLIVGLIVARFLGPEEYGKFALAVAVMTFGQTLAFEWIRQSAVRFYSERTRREAPKIRATLDAAFSWGAVLFAPVALAFAFLGPQFALPRDLFALASAASIANGLFDYQTALVRARFDDRLYIRVIVTKNLLAMVVTTGAAWATGSAKAALVGGMTSLLGSLLIWRSALGDRGVRLKRSDPQLARHYAGYAAPIVAAVVLYQLIPLANRDLAAQLFGFAETGRFALAYDLGQRAVMAIGSALDVLLFQIAVRAHDIHGVETAKGQVARNIAIVFAVLAPACVGIWIVLPSIEVLIVPQAFRGPFAHFLGLMLPGLFSIGMAQFAINAIFQIARKTLPMIAAALAACIADPLFILVLPRGSDASSLALAQSLAFAVGLVVLIGFAQANAPQWPRVRDLALTLVACAGMAALAGPMRSLRPGLLLMLTQMFFAGSFYVLIVASFDVAGLRSAFVEKIAPLIARLSRKGGIFKIFLPLRLG